MMITRVRRFACCFAVTCVLMLAAQGTRAQDAPPAKPADPKVVLADVLRRWADVIEPRRGLPAKTFTTKVIVTKAKGLPDEAAGGAVELSYQAPDRLRVAATVGRERYTAGRIGQQLWAHMPGKKFAIVGTPDVPRFKRYPDEKDNAVVPLFALPGGRLPLALAPMMVTTTLAPPAEINGTRCEVLKLVPLPRTAEMLNIDPAAEATIWVREGDRLPVRVSVKEPRRGIDAQVEFAETAMVDPLPQSRWAFEPAAGEKVERVAVGHLLRFMMVAPRLGDRGTPILGPATGERQVLATEGEGRLELIDGTRVLFLKGSPQGMGRQHGTLLRREIRDVCGRILYGIGVGSSLPKGSWFFGEIEDAQARLEPFIDKRHLAEMDSLAAAAGVHPQEARLANFFPELFHCSGFAIFGKATKDGRMYHGRVLDYMRGVGLEQNAVVIVHQPDYGHAWVNLSYAGFVGSVTAMNERGISIGEMGGAGEGEWDGKPMAELMREVMERAGTLDEAVEIMRRGPRTCQYYYVISDGKTKDAVGIAATPDSFEVVRPGQSHPLLPHAIEDAVLLSAGDRYEHLAKRVKDGYGTFDPQSAIKLMTRPVCMTSNIQSVLFAPDTLDLWVANADGVNVASHTRFTKYNLKDLLASDAAAQREATAR